MNDLDFVLDRITAIAVCTIDHTLSGDIMALIGDGMGFFVAPLIFYPRRK